MDYFNELRVEFVHDYSLIRDSTVYCSTFHRMGVMTGAKVSRLCDGTRVTMETPFVYLTPAGTRLQWQVEAGKFRNNFRFDFSGPRGDRMAAALLEECPGAMRPIEDPVPFLRVLEEIRKEFFRPPSRIRSARLQNAAESFAVLFCEAARRNAAPGVKYVRELHHIARRMRELAEGETFNQKAEAAALGVSPAHFRRLFREQIGVPPAEYLQHCRLTLALRLMNGAPALRLKELSARCGFSSPTEFTRFFRRRMHCAPSRYQKNLAE